MEPVVRRRKKQPTTLDPVVLWATIVDRIEQMDGTRPDTFVNTVSIKGRLHKISAADVRNHIKQAVQDLNNEGLDLQITPQDVGTHSIRSSFATLLANRGVDEKKIMLHGRWKSVTFRKYIRKDVTTTDITTKISNVCNFNLCRLI